MGAIFTTVFILLGKQLAAMFLQDNVLIEQMIDTSENPIQNNPDTYYTKAGYHELIAVLKQKIRRIKFFKAD